MTTYLSECSPSWGKRWVWKAREYLSVTLAKMDILRKCFRLHHHSRPHMTFAVDWALKTNYLSIYLSITVWLTDAGNPTVCSTKCARVDRRQNMVDLACPQSYLLTTEYVTIWKRVNKKCLQHTDEKHYGGRGSQAKWERKKAWKDSVQCIFSSSKKLKRKTVRKVGVEIKVT